jgi:hypothetical protein
MASAWNTLAGLIQFNDANNDDINVSDLLDDSPLLQVMFAKPASNGTLHKYLKQTVASSNAFRAANAGLTKTYSQDEQVTDTLKILDGSFSVDKAIADAYRGGPEAYIMKEMMRTMRQRFFELESQLINGVNNDASGFVGLRDDPQLNAISDEMVVAAATAGTTADSQTSVYLIRTGDDDCAMVMGNDGEIIVSDTVVQAIYDNAAALTTYPGYYTGICGYSGFQIGGARSAARIVNVETALTDDDIYNALSLFPAARQPNIIAMSRKALKLLRESRTATNATGAPAPRPTDVEGIPIVVTDGVTNTEAVVS